MLAFNPLWEQATGVLEWRRYGGERYPLRRNMR